MLEAAVPAEQAALRLARREWRAPGQESES